jgi:DNA-directed RNA polymerase subunit omega
MARITVEDCIKQVKNQYDLVILAKERTVQLGRGAAPAVDPENDKKPVIALREIGETKITPEELRESIVNKLRLIPDYQEEEELEEVDNDTFRQMYQGGLSKSEMEKSATRKFTARVPRIESKPVKQVEETNIEAESDVSASIEEAVESETNIEEQQEDIISVEESSKESDDNAIPANLDPIEESQLSEDISETLSSEEISVEDEPTKEE